MRLYSLYILIATMCFLSACNQQQQPATDVKGQQEALQKKILENSRKYKDINSGSLAIQTLLALDSVKYSGYRDSLMLLYYGGGAYPQALLLANELVKEKGRDKDSMLLTVLAISSEGIGKYDESLKFYKALYEVSGQADHLYQVAASHLRLRNPAESKKVVAQLWKDPKLKETNVTFIYGPDDTQQVPLEAALYNIEGYFSMSEQKYQEALTKFQKALQIDPEFLQAQENIRMFQQGAQ